MLAGLLYCEVDKKDGTPTQSGTRDKPQTAFCKEGGHGILGRLQKLEEEVHQMRAYKDELTMLRPLRQATVDIRSRFFATSRDRVGMGGVGLRTSRDEGNKAAHAGDVVTDICLLKHNMIQYHQTFDHLYGMDWRTATELIGKLIKKL